jgi:2-oxoacid:acceptor oxidoreductase delta subunit (pyruvate/2-ketoisovalerate family)
MKRHSRDDKPIVFEHERDVPLMAISLGTMLFNKTGTWKNIEPFYANKMPPCNDLCPAGEDIVLQLALVKEKKFDEAVRLLKSENPFPATCGRVCPHFCESECNRKELGGSVSIRATERFLGDYALETGWRPRRGTRNGKKVAIVGAGPAGLTCAHFLNLWGYKVTVFDEQDKPGGMMRVGIPTYRLPREVLDAEIGQLENSGVRIECGARLGDSLTWSDLRRFDATCIATGFHESRGLGIPGDDLKGVLAGVGLLDRMNSGKRVRLGQRIGIIGGGNTAMDVARSVLRRGKRPVVLYRRTRDEMPAIPEEVDDAIEEGVEIRFLVAPTKVIGRSGTLTHVECTRMKLGAPDESGRRRPLPLPGSEFKVKLDNLICAIGEESLMAFLPPKVKRDWRILVDKFGMTGEKGVFAAGDIATGEGTVTHAIGSGKKAAVAVHRFLTGRRRTIQKGTMRFSSRNCREDVTRLEDLNTYYFEHEDRLEQERLAISQRKKGFKEVNLGFDETTAVEEATRCLSCGTCNLCEKCYVYCPDLAVRWKRGRVALVFDYDYCKGCGICSEECPRDAIDMREVLRVAGGGE